MTRESNRAIKPAERPAASGTARANQNALRKMTVAEGICGKTAEALQAEQQQLKAECLARLGKRAA